MDDGKNGVDFCRFNRESIKAGKSRLRKGKPWGCVS